MFKVGDKVKCISIARSFDAYAQAEGLKRGNVYVVAHTEVMLDNSRPPRIILAGGKYWQNPKRFVKLKKKSHLPGWW